jgi:uncharacterized membrane protein YdjX (TVP38/TMEM64 family)
MNETGIPPPAPGRGSYVRRLAVLTGLLLVAGAALAFARGRLDIESLAARETQLRGLVAEHPATALIGAFLVYVIVTGLSLPGATAMSVLYGWLFGFWTAIVLVSFASTSGATVAFLLSRYLLGEFVQARYGHRLTAFNRAIEREGAFYLFTLRLIPQVPFFVLNAVMGLTKLPVRTYWWVSQLGMLPATCVFVFAGASAPSLKTVAERGLSSLLDWKLIVALTLLGVMPLALKKVVDVVRRERG